MHFFLPTLHNTHSPSCIGGCRLDLRRPVLEKKGPAQVLRHMQTKSRPLLIQVAGDMNFVTRNVRTGYLVVQCSLASVLLLLFSEAHR